MNLFLAGAMALLVGGCSTDAALQNVMGINAEGPLFRGLEVAEQNRLVFTFSKPVQVVQGSFDPALQAHFLSNDTAIVASFVKKPAAGEKFTADLMVQDDQGNTLNVLAPFRSRNDRIPNVKITEVRTEASKPRGEYVELYIENDGNLGALRLFAAVHSCDEPIYEFPPVEVKKGDYVLFHTRSYAEMNAVDELETDLALSAPQADANLSASAVKNLALDAPDDVRDLWYPDTKELIRKTDCVWLADQDGKILDAVMFCAEPDKWEKNGAFATAKNILTKAGAWSGGAFDCTGTTLTKPVCRTFDDKTAAPAKDTNTAADWYVAEKSNTTPGKPNK